MLETLRIISYMVWIGVGVTSIGAMFWGFSVHNRLFSSINIEKDED